MDENKNETEALPFQNRVEKLEPEGQRGITQGQLLLVVAAVALAVSWAVGLQLYDPTAQLDTQEDAPVVAEADTIQKTRTSGHAPTTDIAPEQLAWRDQALGVLEKLVPRLKMLEQKAVRQWAAEDYKLVVEILSVGEQAYSEQRFRDARDRYQESLDLIEALEAEMPSVFVSLVERGTKLIAEKAYGDALEPLEIAGLIEPGNRAVAAAINTATQGKAVDHLLIKARFSLGKRQASDALAFLKEAASLDPARVDIKQLTTEAQTLSRQLVFRRHMRSGHLALAEGRFSEAISAFVKAAKLEPENAEAAESLRSAKKQKMDHQLTTLRQQAGEAMNQEAWAAAEKLYSDALSLQDGVAFAEAGLETAAFYKEKQTQMRGLLAQPDRLTDSAVASQALTIIAELEQETSLPSRIGQTAVKLKAAIQAYRQLVPVTVHSDGRSAVTIIRGESFRPFRRKAIQLRPGKYTLLARRAGYRDKRVSFQVPVDGQPVVVTISADEKL